MPEIDVEDRLRAYAPIFFEEAETPRDLHARIMNASVRRKPVRRRPLIRDLAVAAAIVVFVAILTVGVTKLRETQRISPATRTTPQSQIIPSPTPSFSPRLVGPSGAAVVQGALLHPGTYDYLDVDGAGFNVRFTVPTGWTWNGRYLSKGGAGLPDGAAIFFDGRLVQVYTDPCHWARAEPVPPTGSSVHDLVAALAAQPMRSATTPTNRNANAVGLSGRWAGMAVELNVPSDIVFADCYQGQFRSWGPNENARSHEGPGQRDLVWAVDLTGNGVEAGGQRLIIDAASFADTPGDVMSEIDAILVSISVGHWG